MVSTQRKRKKQSATADDSLDTALLSQINKLTDPEDEAAAFGSHVASRLRGFSKHQMAIACVEIEKVLLNIEFPSPHPSQYSSFHNIPQQIPPTHTHPDTDNIYDYDI